MVRDSQVGIDRGMVFSLSRIGESGRWFVRLLNGVEQHYISDTASAFDVLAPKAGP